MRRNLRRRTRIEHLFGLVSKVQAEAVWRRDGVPLGEHLAHRGKADEVAASVATWRPSSIPTSLSGNGSLEFEQASGHADWCRMEISMGRVAVARCWVGSKASY